ncbi:winged helix-turn-helix domain-containing protein [Luteimonas sp. MC1572]|uniref:winged helix-turn-helix domain-containing protein n=1 Tax=Luteimonas sp. MC1572 TaxID=2799325 RepID=UPI0018F082E3|nr:winged helix-turn-helix domain-containing protein [Luteimonas sp. MC1572]MBJ6980858.1 winged helix-turn-helix domain-containing protein [Luteimonas sp. MC1572]QQO02218.1 winged helix-turn-helix domain-containing protein [Luteimonas sp. MC1572]
MPGSPARHRHFGPYCLDIQARELRARDGSVLPLTARAFDTLCCLVDNRDRVVSKDELLATVWAGRVVEENNLTQAVSTLRRVLGGGRYIATVPGRGYRFVADVADGDGHAAAPVPMPAPWWARHVAVPGAVMFLVALLAAVAWSLWDWPPRAASRPEAALAVLPFRALSAPDDELLGLGLAETLITRLGRSGELRVRSLASSQRVAGAHPDAQQAASQLGATHVIEGSTQRVGGSIRVNARLVAADSGAIVWADTFDTDAQRVFTLQDRIAGAVTDALALSPIVLPERARSACDGADPQAYRAWLRGHHLLQRPDAARLEQALAAFRSAIDLDPACTRAYAGLALAWRGLVHTDREPAEMFPLAKAAVARALEIDPESPEALVAQGRNRHLYDWDWPGAETSLQQAIALNPSLMEARFAYAHLLVDLGRFEEGLAQARQASELDPLSPMISALEAGFLTAARQPEAARLQVERALALQPDSWIALLVRGGMALDRGDSAAAIADLERGAERAQRTSQMLAALAAAYAAAGDHADTLALLRELESRAAKGYVPATSLAAVHVALGDRDAALDWLERAWRERDIRMAFLKVDARWNDVRDEPRFQALSRRLGLEGGQAYGRY